MLRLNIYETNPQKLCRIDVDVKNGKVCRCAHLVALSRYLPYLMCENGTLGISAELIVELREHGHRRWRTDLQLTPG